MHVQQLCHDVPPVVDNCCLVRQLLSPIDRPSGAYCSGVIPLLPTVSCLRRGRVLARFAIQVASFFGGDLACRRFVICGLHVSWVAVHGVHASDN